MRLILTVKQMYHNETQKGQAQQGKIGMSEEKISDSIHASQIKIPY